MIVLFQISKLKLDVNIYPRAHVDTQHLSEIWRVMQSGATLPPIIVDKKTKIVIDGWHRIAVFKRAKQKKIPVEFKAFPNKEAMLEAAITANLHGRALSTYEHAICILRATKLAMPDTRLAAALKMPIEYISKLRATRITPNTSGDLVPLKGTSRYLSGTTIDSKQVRGNEIAMGPPPMALIGQLINMLKNRLVPTNAPAPVITRLTELSRVLNSWLQKAGVTV